MKEQPMPSEETNRQRIEASIQHCYSTWGETYHDDYYGANAAYPPVHVELLRRLVKESGAKTLLDAGCGPASFLRYLAGDGISLHGFDLTGEMVVEAKRVLSELGLDASNICQGSVLERDAFAPPGAPREIAGYESAVCVGVLPHIPEDQEAEVFSNLQGSVRSGGTVIVEARNQLFSLFTLNRPSYEFFSKELIRADRIIERAGNDRAKVEGALGLLQQRFRMDLPPIRRGKSSEPGYDEVLSRTHNPLVLRETFAAAGFANVRVLFYHFHAMPPLLESGLPEIFLRESVDMEHADDWRGYFMASAFLLVGNRA
jgi:2-polyprenyl-3-methyl-5-hydroxy-6-metoxy-1,4-benzoquinol methylase